MMDRCIEWEVDIMIDNLIPLWADHLTDSFGVLMNAWLESCVTNRFTQYLTPSLSGRLTEQVNGLLNEQLINRLTE